MIERRCYALHIMQSNSLESVANERVTNVIRKYDGGVLAPEKTNALLHLATFIFKSRNQRDMCAADLKALGLDVESDPRRCYLPIEYL